MISQLWTRDNIAWLAGLAEGDGCFTSSTLKTGHSYVSFNVTMCDEDVIMHAREVMGFGNVRGPFLNKLSTKPIWSVTSYRRNEVYALAMAMYPHLGDRRQAKVRELFDLRQPPTHPAPSTSWTPENVAWMAGYVEAEGSFGCYPTPSGNPQRKLQISSVDHDVLCRFLETAGVGTLTGPYVRKNYPKPYWQYQVVKRGDAESFARELYLLMGDRRRAKLDEVFGFDDLAEVS